MATGNSKKHGRNAKKCQKYRLEGRRERNKARRIAKEEKRQAKFKARKEARKAAIEAKKKQEVVNGDDTTRADISK
jgi:hypothetical protein